MKFTLSWLNKYLKTKKSLKDICDKLTMLGIEVSEVIDNPCIVGGASGISKSNPIDGEASVGSNGSK